MFLTNFDGLRGLFSDYFTERNLLIGTGRKSVGAPTEPTREIGKFVVVFVESFSAVFSNIYRLLSEILADYRL